MSRTTLDAPRTGGPAEGSVSVPISDLDWMSGGERIVYVIGPFATPPRQRMVDALVAVAQLGPQSKVGLQLAAAADGWIYDAANLREWCENLVVEIPPISGPDALDLLRSSIREQADRPPLQFLLAGEFAVLRMNHLLGDAQILLGLFDVALAGPDVPLPGWLLAEAAPNPLALAVRETFARNPALLRKVVQSQRSRFARSESGAKDTKDRGTVLVPWQRAAEAAYARTSPTALRDLKAWTRASPDSVTLSAAILVAVRRALVQAGIPVSGESSMIYDSRRYLPGGAVTTGNFIAGLPVPPGFSDDPGRVTQIVKDNVDAASPLAAMVVGVARSRLSRRRSAKPATTVSAHPEALVVLSNLGLRRELDAMNWTSPKGEELFITWSEPSAPDHIVLGMLQLRGALHISAFFHGNVFDVERVQSALDLALADPVSFLNADSPR